MNFNPENVGKFFDNLSDVMERHNFEPHNIFNVDETGCTTVQKPNKVISLKGVKQVGAITSQERGTLVTMCFAINALGNSIPPMFVFPLVRYHDHFVRDGPDSCIGSANRSGWMQEEDFLIFIKHFAKFSKPSETNRVLLILDNHASHLYLPVIDFCRDNYITLLSFPPHTSHKLQPLDRGVYGPFKKFYNNSCDQWMKNNPGKRMTMYNIPSIAREAIQLAAVPKNITSGFRCCGIWPFNRNIFSDDEFAPSSVTDRPLNTASAVGEKEAILCPASTSTSSIEMPLNDANLNIINIPCEPSTPPKTSPIPPAAFYSPEEIRPLLKADFSKPVKTNKRAKGKTAILTDTPEKNLIEEKFNKKKVVAVTKKLHGSQTKKKNKQTIKRKVSENLSSSEDDSICIVCLGPYKESKEDWLQCRNCKEWAHCSCAGNNALFVCKNCDSDAD
ncbi:hypothetical protein PPYR_01335 [Photinus pyralis]|uniref:DDE-1 domain-containing protein n=2 Tax=Photinus pyralis TaxID=7054 RepID=A0A5N4B445_PHOPY|nr:hypothetical protein PPYR_01335 [Photinus pyralis]